MKAEEGVPLIVVTAAAVLLPGVARRLVVPVAVVEILFGVAVGRSGLGLGGISEGEVVRSLGDLGFALFLFVAGMEIEVTPLIRRGIRALFLPLACSALTLVVAFAASRALGWTPWLGLAAGATSVPLMAAVLRELGLARSPVAQRMLMVAGIGELVTILVLAGVEVSGHSGGGPAELVVPVLRSFVPVVATVLGALVLRTLLWWYPAPFSRLVAVDDPQELGMRAGFALMALFVGLAALGGIEPLLGAFVAGLLVSYALADRHALEHKLASMAYGFFVPIFFIQVGMRVTIVPAELLADLPLVLTMLGVMALARIPAGILLAGAGLRHRDALAGAFLLSAPLTLLTAVVNLGTRAGAIPPRLEAAAITVAILASVLFPALARRLLKSGRTLPASDAVPRSGNTLPL
jgi:Kef-type K+ transport system membrane component KefB